MIDLPGMVDCRERGRRISGPIGERYQREDRGERERQREGKRGEGRKREEGREKLIPRWRRRWRRGSGDSVIGERERAGETEKYRRERVEGARGVGGGGAGPAVARGRGGGQGFQNWGN